MAGLLIGNKGSRFEWLVTGREGGFAAHYCVSRPDKSIEAEAFSSTVASRDEAIAWLLRSARARGFDARGIK
jgi:hypothetical protein